MKTVLGIDPGVSETGWAVLDSKGLRASGLVKTYPEAPLPDRLKQIHGAIAAILAEHKPDEVAIEEMFFIKAAKSIQATLQARGVILLAAAQAGLPISHYNPRTVKITLTGSGDAAKAQMQRMLQKALTLPEILRPDDVADAAAIALCHLRTNRYKRLKVLERIG